MLDISVIICAYTDKRWDYLAAAVASVQRQTKRPRELIIVVDHNPALLERIQERFPDVRAVANSQPRGSSGAKNAGVAVAEGEIILFLDDDAEALPDWLEQIWAAYADPKVIGVGGALTAKWPDKRPAWFPVEFDWVVGCTYRGLPEVATPVRNLIGANMSFRREVFEKVLLYSGIGHVGSRPFGGSDPDFCIRVGQAFPDHVLLHEPKARVLHNVSQQRTTWGYFITRCYNEGLSKSLLTRRVGSKAGLSSERAYTLRTLPTGVLRGLAEAATGLDRAGARRAWAIVAGFSATVWGYVVGSVRQRLPTYSGSLTGEVAA
ncbi:glycosyltransferase family 2 protein [Chloroflexia bacterium SDU3-3]|nr:glycosyltransferase family 2 protein [Chloroflexia bacterium SDU3-3]